MRPERPAQGNRVALLTISVLLLAGGAGGLDAQGISVRIAPEASSVRWSSEAGLENDVFYGGGLSIGFGRFVSLHTSYRFANSLRTTLGDTDYAGGNAEENVLDASLFSTGVGLRIGNGRIAPVVVGTGGVLGMSPDGREDVKQVFVGYGGGVDARIRPWLNGQILVEDLRFRVDRSTLAGDTQGSGVAPDPDRTDSERSTAITLSFGARLGGGRPSARADALDQDMTRAYSGDGLMVRAELQGGVLRFDKALLLSERPYFGVRGGVDFGPFFGLRGSYARGAQRDLAGFVGMTSWAGEAQFNVGRITDWSTHLLLGFGQITFDPDFLDEGGTTPDDQNAVILGAGVGIPLGSRTQLLVSLRDHVTSVGEVSGVSTPDDLRHNFGLTAGVSFLLRGSPRRPGPSAAGPSRPSGQERQRGAPEEETQEPPQARQTTDSTSATREPAPGSESGTRPAAEVADSIEGRPGYQSDRTVSIPLPTEGELFIRYGPARGQAAATPTVSPPTPDTAGAATGVSSAELAALEQRLAARLDSISARAAAQTRTRTETSPEVEALTRQVEELARLVRETTLRSPETSIVSVSGGVPTEVVTEIRDPFFQGLELRVGGSSLRDAGPGASLALDALFGDRVIGPLQPYAGFHLSQVGVDGTLGGSPYDGSVTSYGVGAGARLGLPDVGPVQPSLSLGVRGVTGGTQGDTPADADVVESLYGGFVMGPRVALTGAWRRTPDATLQVVGSIARLWAGARGGWTVQAGVRWSRPGRPTTFTRPVEDPSPRGAGPSPSTDRQERPPDQDPDAPEVAADSATAAGDAALRARLEEVERALQQEREARMRLEATADSAAAARRAATEAAVAEAQAAAARADSLAAVADTLARIEREREAAEAALVTVERRLRDLVGVLPSVQSVRRTDDGIVVALGGTLFPTSATALGPESRPQVERVARVILDGPYESLLVSGHTDATGSPETNRVISRARAEAVRQILVETGFEPGLVDLVAAGERDPVARNDTAEGRRLNRRVEILIRGPG